MHASFASYNVSCRNILTCKSPCAICSLDTTRLFPLHLNAEDIVRVANKIANKTLVNLDELNKQAKESPEEFIKIIANKQKIEEDRKQKEVKTFLVKLREESEEKLQVIRKDIKETHEQELSVISSQYEKKIKRCRSD